jgi:hypothetical protein
MSEAFEELWSLWPNKSGKAQTRLAYDYIIKNHPYSSQDYIKAAKLWIEKATDFQHENQLLKNWLHDEKFIVEIDEIKSSGGFENAIKNVQMYQSAAVVVLGEWNRLRRPWWAKVDDINGRSYVVEKALRDEYFQRKWKIALAKLVDLMEYPERDSIGKIKLQPTIDWFCDAGEKTVARIIEGYYGFVKPKTVIQKFDKPDVDKDFVRDILAVTRQNIENKEIKQVVEGDWKVIKRMTEIRLTYKGVTIETKDMPLTRNDQDALYRTMVNTANNFNNIGYEPDLTVTTGFE